jgi:REP element-mobilizing transposase RayT
MGRPLRIASPGCYHVITRATGGGAFFREDEDRVLLLHLLSSTAWLLEWEIHAYCLLTTHYHVVLGTPKPNLSRGMQRINSVYVRSINERWGRFGTLVAERFRSRPIESEEYFIEACRYVFLNPVRAELCALPEEWPWSGGIAFAGVANL